MALSRVSAPVTGLVPLRSFRSHSKGMVFNGNWASVKSAFSTDATSKIVELKYDPTATVFFREAPSMLVSSNEAPVKSAPEKSALTYIYIKTKQERKKA